MFQKVFDITKKVSKWANIAVVIVDTLQFFNSALEKKGLAKDSENKESNES